MKRYRIGLMVGNKSIDYLQAIRMGVQNVLEDTNHVLIAISDHIPFHSRSNAKAYLRVAFEVAARLDLDAIIVPAGIIASYLSSEYDTIEDLLRILDPQKTLVIEREIEGFRCIGKNNDPGMHECMKHLIETCGFSKIAFLGGPPSSTGGKRRESIYLKEMQDHGLEVPPSFIEHGEFSGECGDSIDKLIDNNPGLEAIACCCDLEAHSVYSVMRRRKLTVGSDIAVTGFDDHVMSAHLDPPLSTVHMTSYDLGRMAAREALRICENKAQKEFMQNSYFIARASCGENQKYGYDVFHSLLKHQPFPALDIARILVDATITLAPRRVADEFEQAMTRFVEKCSANYEHHLSAPQEDGVLFDSQDLAILFHAEYRDRLSLEGFHSSAIMLLHALADLTPEEESGWVINQISSLHLSVARMLNVDIEETKKSMGIREWTSFHMVDDALRESMNPRSAYKLMLDELHKLGVKQAFVYLLREPVPFMDARSFALSDTLLPIGKLTGGTATVLEGSSPTSLQKILNRIISDDSETTLYTVGGIMAGNELLGIAAFDRGTLDEDGQLIAFLNLGIALKHLQMIAIERESNELLSKSNLLLERQSHYDEMTGALNRRGFMDKTRVVMQKHLGENGALFYMDLDGLKGINDNLGHDTGDEAIRNTTNVLDAFLPQGSIIGRLGGDEFVAFTLVKNESEIESIGASIDTGMNAFNTSHALPYKLSISYGGVFIPLNRASFSGINKSLVQADERLYQMKRAKGSKRIPVR